MKIGHAKQGEAEMDKAGKKNREHAQVEQRRAGIVGSQRP